ncbi:MAG TPA: hypothetical protein PLF16_02360, partial [Candidatus Staskawiczbacteria bacterium]|nr:hypothetical protein [Candidatus Staskawiczbacteria bacterium]
LLLDCNQKQCIILEDHQNWQEAVKNARGIMDYYFDTAFSHFDKNTQQGRLAIENIILPAIKRLPNKIEQSLWIGKLAPKLGVREDAVIAELAKVKIEEVAQVAAQAAVETKVIRASTPEGRIKMLQERIISLILKSPYSLNLVKIQDIDLFSGNIKSFLEKAKEVSIPIFARDDESKIEEDLKAVFADISAAHEHKEFFDTLALRAEVELENEGPEEAELCLAQLKDIKLRNVLENLSLQIAAEENADKIEELKKEFNIKAKELHYGNKKI